MTAKFIFLMVLLAGILGVAAFFYVNKEQPPFRYNLALFYQQLFKPVKTVDRAFTKVLPISEIDEKLIGDEIKARFNVSAAPANEKDTATDAYLTVLIKEITVSSKKPFDYQVFLIEGPPNAFAMPGGSIGVTKGLFEILENEAELISILSHEAGHIERGHLFDAVRGEMLKRRIKEASVIALADAALFLLPRIAFSKVQEDEADEFAFRMMVVKGYDVHALGSAFDKMLAKTEKRELEPDLIQDFFSTHPYLESRSKKFHSQADRWYSQNPGAKMYIGRQNFQELVSKSQREILSEYR
jgi:predicted Zn-dependent protease